MLRLWLAVTASLMLAAPALAQAQRPIQWISNAQRGVAQAKRMGLPVMFYVTGSGRGDGGDLEDAQQATFRNALVRGIAEERFVPVRLPQSSDTKNILEQLGVSPRLAFSVVYATPDGELLGVAHPGVLANASALARHMTQMFRKYRRGVFEEELRPKLEDEESKPADLIRALRRIEKLLIVEADKSVAKLLERDDLTSTVRKEVYDVLAELSTGPAVDALLEAAANDKLAERALGRCTPAAAGHLLKQWDRQKNPEKFFLIYEAMADICNIRGTKPPGFWEGPKERLIKEEITRVSEAVREAAQRWKAKYEAYR
jgi:hypothetical protein